MRWARARSRRSTPRWTRNQIPTCLRGTARAGVAWLLGSFGSGRDSSGNTHGGPAARRSRRRFDRRPRQAHAEHARADRNEVVIPAAVAAHERHDVIRARLQCRRADLIDDAFGRSFAIRHAGLDVVRVGLDPPADAAAGFGTDIEDRHPARWLPRETRRLTREDVNLLLQQAGIDIARLPRVRASSDESSGEHEKSLHIDAHVFAGQAGVRTSAVPRNLSAPLTAPRAASTGAT